jgi:citrate synthase
LRSRRERIPGFGHKVYRGPDPRFVVLLDAVRELAARSTASAAKMDIVDAMLTEVGRAIPKHANIDAALGALSWIGALPAEVPIFAVARIAGWGAHYAEELEAPPVRYRGIAG